MQKDVLGGDSHSASRRIQSEQQKKEWGVANNENVLSAKTNL
jgi:hypothetical protein